MEANKILQSDLIDIVFDQRNKEYGAYELRKGYNLRLLISIAWMTALTAGLFGVNYIVNRTQGSRKPVMTVLDVQLVDIKEEKKNEPLPPPPPLPQTVSPKVEIIKFTPPKIVKDNEVREEEKPPVQEKIEEARIGVINQEGVKDEGVVAPPAGDGGKGIVETPRRPAEDYNQVFTKVEIESEYPGGAAAWLRYLNKNFRYPPDAIADEIQGTVVVQFIVDQEGGVSEVAAISGPQQGELREEAVRVIRQSGKWIAAIQNGRKVKSYKKQPVIFKLEHQ